MFTRDCAGGGLFRLMLAALFIKVLGLLRVAAV
jgi:hypothetical protein